MLLLSFGVITRHNNLKVYIEKYADSQISKVCSEKSVDLNPNVGTFIFLYQFNCLLLSYEFKYIDNMKQHTFDGRTVDISDMSQQHLSNAYYYSLTCGNPIESVKTYLEELNKRFDGEILEYRPKVNFKQEIAYLRYRDMILEDGKIMFNGHIIGKIDDEIINDIDDLK